MKPLSLNDAVMMANDIAWSMELEGRKLTLAQIEKIVEVLMGEGGEQE